MDFNDTPEEAAYRAKVRDWLAVAAPRERTGDRTTVAPSRAWQAKKADAGYACITWPAAWGGQDGTAIQQVIFQEEEARYPIPFDPFKIGLGMCIPTVMSVADEATKTRFVGPAIRGDEIWCQLFSEPAAGSDLAAARTRAVPAADGSGDWIVNGQKVWTTGAHYSDYGLLLVRTDPDVPKHRGLTMFWVDMRAPGIEVRGIHQMNGGSEFNEIYFTDVRLPDGQRLGALNDGWRVSLITLMNERLAVGGAAQVGWAEFMELARTTPDADGRPMLEDRSIRDKLADWYVQAEGLRHNRNRIVTALSRGNAPGPESSIGKIIAAGQMQDLANAAVEMLDQFGIVSDPSLAPLDGGFTASLMRAPGMRIAGGTDEILRNIVAERVLGLPGDIRVDKDVSFKDIPTGR